MITIRSLETKQVVIKLSSMTTAITGTVTKVEQDHGFWIMDSGLEKSLREFGFPAVLAKPALFVPFSSLDFLVAASESDEDR